MSKEKNEVPAGRPRMNTRYCDRKPREVPIFFAGRPRWPLVGVFGQGSYGSCWDVMLRTRIRRIISSLRHNTRIILEPWTDNQRIFLATP